MWKENLYIYFDNLSSYYIWSLVISFCALLFTVYIHIYYKCNLNNASNTQENKNESSKEDSEEICTRTMKNKNLVDETLANLSPQELIMEKEVESQQLTAILNLLKAQEKNEIETLEDLKHQMKLYR